VTRIASDVQKTWCSYPPLGK